MSQCLLEGLPLLDGEAIDCHVVFARAAERVAVHPSEDHHEMVRLVRISATDRSRRVRGVAARQTPSDDVTEDIDANRGAPKWPLPSIAAPVPHERTRRKLAMLHGPFVERDQPSGLG